MPIVAVVFAVACAGCGNQQSNNSKKPGAARAAAIEASKQYVLKYEWPEKPKVGSCTLKVKLLKSGTPVREAEVTVSYDMPSMRGTHMTNENMKQNDKGDFLLPINFAIAGDWEIVVLAYKDGKVIAEKTILVDI